MLKKTVLYTGTVGPAMSAVITDLGSQEFSIEMSDGWGEWKDVRRYLVEGPSNTYDATIALNTGGFGVNAPHPQISIISGGPVKSVSKIQSKNTAATPGYVMEVVYSRPPMGIWGDTNVLARPVVINFGFTFVQIPTEKDGLGYVVTNSAGDVFDPPQTIEKALLRIRCAKWLNGYSVTNAQNMLGHVNEASVTLPNSIGTVDSRCLKCLNFAPANDIIKNAAYVFTQFEFEAKLDKFDRHLIDRGFRAWYADSSSTARRGKLVAASNLEPIPQPILLNGAGAPLFPADVTVGDLTNGFSNFTSASPTQLPAYLTAMRATDGGGGFYLPYEIEQEADFSIFESLGL